MLTPLRTIIKARTKTKLRLEVPWAVHKQSMWWLSADLFEVIDLRWPLSNQIGDSVLQPITQQLRSMEK